MAARVPLTTPSTPSLLPKHPRSNQQSDFQNPVDSLRHYIKTIIQGRLFSKPTIISAMKACSLISATAQGRAIHAHIFKAGFGSDRFIASSVVCFYSACGLLSSARQVFDGISEKDTALQTTMLVGYIENGDITTARILFEEMPERDVIAWNAMLSGYTHCGLPTEALELFREMQISMFRPNVVTLLTALSACSQLGCLALGEWIHAYIDRNSDDVRWSPTLHNSLMHMYAKCGRLDAAVRVFLEKEPRNLESWNTMLTSFAIHGYGTSALSLFSQMIKLGVLPDRISFVGLLMACTHVGMVDHARRCINCMTRMYNIEPKAEHYGCLVDVLSRGGHLEEARMLIQNMPFEPDAYVWGALLGGCFTYCNYELGLEAAQNLIELEPREEGRYTALLNLHAMVGRIEEAVKLRKVMADMGIKQSSGSSTIEIEGVVHEFLAGDGSHYQLKDIYSKTEKICLLSELHE